MAAPMSPRESPAQQWLRRLDRLAGDLNVVLVLFAIGLAVLDLTVFGADIAVTQITAAPAASVTRAPALDLHQVLQPRARMPG